MPRALRPALVALAAVLALAGSTARAAPRPLALAGAVAAATGAELRQAHGAVDAALQERKRRLDVWQKAQRLRDAAAADVARRKKAVANGGAQGGALEEALQRALALDESAAHARSRLLAAESEVASRGARLLQLYDALLVERRRAVEVLAPQSSARAQAVAAYRELAAQRDAVRQALLPVLPSTSIDTEAAAELPAGVDLEARPDDDVETLLEKADLARDLEDRFLRQAEAVKKRIAELEDEAAVQRGVSGVVGRSQLFDEEDRRLPVVRTEASAAPPADRTRGSTSTDGAAGAPSPAPPASGGAAGGVGGSLDNGGQAPQGVRDPSSSPAEVPSSAFALTPPAAPTVVHGEQAMATPTADTAIAGLLSSSRVSLESLKALEARLKARARELDQRQRALRGQASH